MDERKARVSAVLVGAGPGLAKASRASIDVDIDGIAGDRHRGIVRQTWAGDKQPKGTRRRNERQWSAVSVEELGEISEAMDLEAPLSAGTLGANLCLEGIADLSRLPKGTLLTFPSGAVLQVEEYNPPCHDMGKSIAAACRQRDGRRPPSTAFSKAAKLKRGIVGIVDVPGAIRVGDEVKVEIYEPPAWLRRAAD